MLEILCAFDFYLHILGFYGTKKSCGMAYKNANLIKEQVREGRSLCVYGFDTCMLSSHCCWLVGHIRYIMQDRLLELWTARIVIV
jgi:hypothetical protein